MIIVTIGETQALVVIPREDWSRFKGSLSIGEDSSDDASSCYVQCFCVHLSHYCEGVCETAAFATTEDAFDM